MDKETKERMDGLVPIKAVISLKRSAKKIFKSLRKEGFDVNEIATYIKIKIGI